MRSSWSLKANKLKLKVRDKLSEAKSVVDQAAADRKEKKSESEDQHTGEYANNIKRIQDRDQLATKEQGQMQNHTQEQQMDNNSSRFKSLREKFKRVKDTLPQVASRSDADVIFASLEDDQDIVSQKQKEKQQQMQQPGGFDTLDLRVSRDFDQDYDLQQQPPRDQETAYLSDPETVTNSGWAYDSFCRTKSATASNTNNTNNNDMDKDKDDDENDWDQIHQDAAFSASDVALSNALIDPSNPPSSAPVPKGLSSNFSQSDLTAKALSASFSSSAAGNKINEMQGTRLRILIERAEDLAFPENDPAASILVDLAMAPSSKSGLKKEQKYRTRPGPKGDIIQPLIRDGCVFKIQEEHTHVIFIVIKEKRKWKTVIGQAIVRLQDLNQIGLVEQLKINIEPKSKKFAKSVIPNQGTEVQSAGYLVLSINIVRFSFIQPAAVAPNHSVRIFNRLEADDTFIDPFLELQQERIRIFSGLKQKYDFMYRFYPFRILLDQIPTQYKAFSGSLGTIKITVLEARDLPDTASFRKVGEGCDPFCVINSTRNWYRTQTTHQSTDPIWNTSFEIPVEDSAQKVSLSVFSEETMRDGFLIGTVAFVVTAVNPFSEREHDLWLPLKHPSVMLKVDSLDESFLEGYIHIRIRWDCDDLLAMFYNYFQKCELETNTETFLRGDKNEIIKQLRNAEIPSAAYDLVFPPPLDTVSVENLKDNVMFLQKYIANPIIEMAKYIVSLRHWDYPTRSLVWFMSYELFCFYPVNSIRLIPLFALLYLLAHKRNLDQSYDNRPPERLPRGIERQIKMGNLTQEIQAVVNLSERRQKNVISVTQASAKYKEMKSAVIALHQVLLSVHTVRSQLINAVGWASPSGTLILIMLSILLWIIFLLIPLKYVFAALGMWFFTPPARVGKMSRLLSRIPPSGRSLLLKDRMKDKKTLETLAKVERPLT